MAEPTPYALTKLFTELVGRKVSFAQVTVAPETKIKQIYAIYQLFPHDTAIVVKMDLALLGSIAGALVGLPDSAVKEHLAASKIDEMMRDAMHEVLNIASTVVTVEGRAVFQKMVTDVGLIEGPARKLMAKPDQKSYFNVLMDGYQGGKLTILSSLIVSNTISL